MRATLPTPPLVAILRGVSPQRVDAVAACLLEAGFRIIEVPLNSPDPFASIGRLAPLTADGVLVGAGTVLDVGAVERVAEVGGRLIVSPNMDAGVIRAAKARGLVCLPGVATPTEGFAALAAGADGLKAFPAEALPPRVLGAWRSVLPKGTRVLPVGGITPDAMADYVKAGAGGFGLGSALFKPERAIEDIGARARAFVAAWRAASLESGLGEAAQFA